MNAVQVEMDLEPSRPPADPATPHDEARRRIGDLRLVPDDGDDTPRVNKRRGFTPPDDDDGPTYL
jgi:hypothetical protein